MQLTIDVSQRELVAQLRQGGVHGVRRGEVELPAGHPLRRRFTSPAFPGGLREEGGQNPEARRAETPSRRLSDEESYSGAK